MFSIRPATEADIPHLADILITGWRESYRYIVDENWLAALDQGEYEEKWQRWMAEEGWNVLLAEGADGAPAGFVSFGKLKTPPPGMSPIRPLYSAEVYALYILPDYWRQGLGRKLLGAAAAALAPERHKSLCLWTLEKNKRAAAFYKALGGERCGKKDVTIGPTAARDICFGWRDTSSLIG